MQKLFVTASVAALLVAGSALAQAPSGSSPAPAGNVQSQQLSADSFVKTVAISDMFEIESSKLAAQKAQSPTVKQFAQQMVNDHQKTSNELKALLPKAKLDKVQVPKQLDEPHAKKLEQLKSASGMQFDETYRQIQAEAHQQAVSLFENYSRSGDNNDLKSWAAEKLPTLQQHLQMAQSLDKPTAPTTGQRP
jgi:putative membrane protein